VATKQLARFFGLSARAVQLWAKDGCPRLKHGRWDLKAVFDWWWENIAPDKLTSGSGDESLAKVRRDYWAIKKERERMRLELDNKDLIPRAKVEDDEAAKVAAVTSGLSLLIDRLPPLLEGRDRLGIRQTLHDEIWKLRDQFAREGRYDPNG
jgi:phage terminase Nu1 subunit (DNA packaging protein)